MGQKNFKILPPKESGLLRSVHSDSEDFSGTGFQKKKKKDENVVWNCLRWFIFIIYECVFGFRRTGDAFAKLQSLLELLFGELPERCKPVKTLA